MAITLTISILTCLLLMFVILVKPSVKIFNKEIEIYWIIPLIGALILIILQKVAISDLINSFVSDSATNPIKVLILFFAMSMLSVYLDETGFFEYLATVTVKIIAKKTFCYILFYRISLDCVYVKRYRNFDVYTVYL